MSNALERIAELHTARDANGNCRVCGIYVAYPCPTRRLCDEAVADMDAARADADRLAAAARRYLNAMCDDPGPDEELDAGIMLVAALAAHDAARTKEGL